MVNGNRRLLLAMCGILLVSAAAATAQAQRLTYTVRGEIRWKKDMGIIPVGPHYKQAAPVPCGQFFVAAVEPGKGTSVAYTENPLVFDSNDPTYNICHYSVQVPADHRVWMIAGMGGVLLLPKTDKSDYYLSDPWIGGSHNTPEGGAERGFTGQTYVTLGGHRRLQIVNFELTYLRPYDPK